jgi:hypothetical protein
MRKVRKGTSLDSRHLANLLSEDGFLWVDGWVGITSRNELRVMAATLLHIDVSPVRVYVLSQGEVERPRGAVAIVGTGEERLFFGYTGRRGDVHETGYIRGASSLRNWSPDPTLRRFFTDRPSQLKVWCDTTIDWGLRLPSANGLRALAR